MIFRRRPVRIRRLRGGDAETWRNLRLDALARHPEAYGSSHDDWAGRPLSAFADQLEAGCIYGAFAGERAVGCMALAGTGDAGEILAVYVRPEFRGRGFARQLLAALETEARGRGMRQLTLSVARQNTGALRFYRRAGFSETGQPSRVLTRDGRFLDLVAMTRPL